MQKTHWKKLVNPDYIGAYSLDPGQDLVLTIKSVAKEVIIGTDGKKEDATVARFVEPQKPMILNRTNQKTISKIHKTPYIEDWAGKQIQIFATDVKAFGEVVEALRIRPFVPRASSGAEKCSVCGNAIMPAGKMSAAEVARYTHSKYGTALCSECATKRNSAAQEAPDKNENAEEHADE